MTNKSVLLKEFEKADKNKTGNLKYFLFNNICFFYVLDHLPLTIWAEIMSNVLQIDLPWLILRSKLSSRR